METKFVEELGKILERYWIRDRFRQLDNTLVRLRIAKDVELLLGKLNDESKLQ